MGLLASMNLIDSSGEKIQGGSRIQGREMNIDVLALEHKIATPSDLQTGTTTGLRQHTPLIIYKLIDSSTPHLNKACCNAETLKSAEVFLYKINDQGQEEAYFKYTLSSPKIIAIQPKISGSMDPQQPDTERLALSYQSIQWTFLDGNYSYTDSWLNRG